MNNIAERTLISLPSTGGGDVGMWWANMPGLYIDGRLANRIIAITCASRVLPPDAGHGGAGAAATQRLANEFLRWLDQARDMEDRVARRSALCMACEDNSDRARGRHRDMAANIYEWLTSSATTVGEQTRWRKQAG